MRVVKTIREIRAFVRSARCAGSRVALVPTMGALHDGHLALVDRARESADIVVVSIFVNPTQFGPGEDFERYPRPLDDDLRALGTRGVDVVFIPESDEMYPEAAEPEVELKVGAPGNHLCGRHRPGHFDGVVQIVAKLLVAVEPDAAVFGLKDAQQFVIINHLVQSFGFPVEIIGLPTMREADGLAMSSRNRYLSTDHRRQAAVLSRSIEAAASRLASGELGSEALVTAMLNTMGESPDLRPQYAEVVDARSLAPIEQIHPGQSLLLAVAGYFDDTRLIDSAFVTAPGAPANR